jgi:hypothetical protein
MVSKALALVFWLIAGVLLALALARSAPAQGCMTRSQCIAADAGYCRWHGSQRCWFPGGRRHYAERHNPVMVTRPIVRPAVHPPIPADQPPSPPPPRPLDSIGPGYALPLMYNTHEMLQRIDRLRNFVPVRAIDSPPPMPVVQPVIVLQPKPAAASEGEESASDSALEASVWPPIERNGQGAPSLARLLFVLVAASVCGACAWGATGPWRSFDGIQQPVRAGKKIVANVIDAMLRSCGTTISWLGLIAMRWGENLRARANNPAPMPRRPRRNQTHHRRRGDRRW